MLRIGRTVERRIVLDANSRQPPLCGRQDLELIDLVVSTMLKQNAVKLVIFDLVGRDVVHVVVEWKRRAAATVAGPSGQHGQEEFGVGMCQVIKVIAVDMPGKNASGSHADLLMAK